MKEEKEIKIDSENLKDFVKKLLRKYPDIKPHKEEDWDWTWSDEGYDALEGGDFPLAEYKFEQLIVSEPDHFDGYEGLASSPVRGQCRDPRPACSERGRKSEAVLLIDHAVKLARNLLKLDGIDRDALNEILIEQREIHDT